MSLFPSLRINSQSIYHLKPSSVLVLLVLQLAIWYPLLSDAYDAMDRQAKIKKQADDDWQKIHTQANRIKEAAFIRESWINHSIESEKQSLPTQWRLEGVAKVAQWQGAFETIERNIALGLQSVSWERTHKGDWSGRFLFDIKVPKSNREYHNWLPIKVRETLFNEKDWQLLSTMKMGDQSSALVAYKQARYWVHQGSWLPSVGLTVASVSRDEVIFQAKGRDPVSISFHSIGEADE